MKELSESFKDAEIVFLGLSTDKDKEKWEEIIQKLNSGEKYDSVWLLAKFVSLSLEQFKDIKTITFTSPKTDVDMSKMMKAIGRNLGISKENIHVQDYKESFCYYMFYQPKELWQYESALFYCDRNEIRAYMLRRMKTVIGRGNDLFVTEDEVARAQMKELAAIYPVLNVDKAKDADDRFRQHVEDRSQCHYEGPDLLWRTL